MLTVETTVRAATVYGEHGVAAAFMRRAGTATGLCGRGGRILTPIWRSRWGSWSVISGSAPMPLEIEAILAGVTLTKVRRTTLRRSTTRRRSQPTRYGER
jgi:hypothetical protein